MRLVALIASTVLWTLPAWADLSWSGPQNIQMGSGPPEWTSSFASYALDVDGNGSSDFLFTFGLDAIFSVSPLGGNTVTTDLSPLGYMECEPLGADTWIDSSLSGDAEWSSDEQELLRWVSLYPGTAGGGPWYDVGNGYLGLEFDAADGTHYGWAEITGLGDYEGGIIHSWAYETTPGDGVMAGTVPEPSSIALLFAGLAVLRLKMAAQKDQRGQGEKGCEFSGPARPRWCR